MAQHTTIPELLDAHRKNVSISIEILPPVRGDGINGFFKIIDEIIDSNPLWIDVTSHSSSVEWIPDSNGSMVYRKNERRKTPGTIAICGAINFKYNVPAVPHILCNGFSREETEDALIDLNYLGINNVLAIRGDGGCEKRPTLHDKNRYAIDLLKQIKNMNKGTYLDQQANPTQFCVGVACYPEKHVEAPNMAMSNQQLLEKQKCGADYAVTQMFFNNQAFLEFCDDMKPDLTIPIIPGLKIISSPKHLVSIPKHFFVDLPTELVNKLGTGSSVDEVRQIGLDWAYEQCVDLIQHGHNHLHFYIMRNTQFFVSLIKRLNADYHFIK
jgi:methylenetetrahydrofolate reductase (NADPH)